MFQDFLLHPKVSLPGVERRGPIFQSILLSLGPYNTTPFAGEKQTTQNIGAPLREGLVESLMGYN